MDIVIRYNAERGFEEAALAFARRLFAEFDEAIDSVTLVPVAEGDLDVRFDGRLVHSTGQAGRPPRLADIQSIRDSDNGPDSAAQAAQRRIVDGSAGKR